MSIKTWDKSPAGNPLNDPYGAWFQGEGKSFAITAREPKQDPDDFAYIFVEDPSYGGFSLEAPDTELEGRRIVAPLRRDSVPQNSTPSGAEDGDAHAFPNGIDAIVAVIDDGVNFGHERFRYAADKSRVAYAWVQDGVATKKSKVPFGREWLQRDINKALVKNTDPNALLSDLDLVDFTRTGIRSVTRRMSHGTHMTDLASGYSVGDPLARQIFVGDTVLGDDVDPSKIALITVQLPFLMTQESSGASYEPFVAGAVEYVLDRAQKLIASQGKKRKIPTLINMSYAIAGGPHNGESPMSRKIAALLDDYNAPKKKGGPNCGEAYLMLPSGNRYMERGHAQIQAANGEAELTLPWRLLPGDQTSSFLELWVPAGAEGTVRVQPSGGKALQYTIGDDARVGENDAGDTICRVSTDVKSGNERKRVMIAVAPSDTTWMAASDRRSPALSGVWTVTLSATNCAEGDWVDAWIQRDESPYLYRANAVQSYFEDPAYERFDAKGDPQQQDSAASVIKREGTLSGLATIASPYVRIVGGKFGHVSEIDVTTGSPFAKPSLYAAEGFSDPRGAVQNTPHFSAVADRSRVLSGVMAAGTSSGSVVAVTGTSAAAPQVVRWLTEWLVANPHKSGAVKPALDALGDNLNEDVGRFGPRLGAGYLGPLQNANAVTHHV